MMKENNIHDIFKNEILANENNRKEKFRNDSKDRLKKIIKKKMETVMIGSLSAIESKFGFLWGHDSKESMTENQKYIYDLFQELRAEILDLGNSQIRNGGKEIDTYTVEWNRYQYNLEVKPRSEG